MAGVTLKDFREDRLARAEASEAREEQKREQRRILDEQYRCEEAAAEAKTKAQLEASEQRLARDRSEASAAAEKALQREATRVLKKQEREKQKAALAKEKGECAGEEEGSRTKISKPTEGKGEKREKCERISERKKRKRKRKV